MWNYKDIIISTTTYFHRCDIDYLISKLSNIKNVMFKFKFKCSKNLITSCELFMKKITQTENIEHLEIYNDMRNVCEKFPNLKSLTTSPHFFDKTIIPKFKVLILKKCWTTKKDCKTCKDFDISGCGYTFVKEIRNVIYYKY